MNDAISRFRWADPADVPVPFAAEHVFARIVATPRSAGRRRRSATRRLVFAGAVAAVISTVGVVAWPSYDGTPPSSAYAITKSGDGVRVEVHWDGLKNTGALQADLRAAGVPATVMRADPACTLPLPAGDPSFANAVDVQGVKSPRESLWRIVPARIPPGGKVVIGVQEPVGAVLVLTRDVPSCFPAQQFGLINLNSK